MCLTPIRLIVNNKEVELPHSMTVAEAVQHLGFGGRKREPAVWINGQSVLQRDYASRLLAAGDEVKFIRIFGGG